MKRMHPNDRAPSELLLEKAHTQEGKNSPQWTLLSLKVRTATALWPPQADRSPDRGPATPWPGPGSFLLPRAM